MQLLGKSFKPSLSFYISLPLFYLFNPYRKPRNVILQKKTYNAFIADNFFPRSFGYMFRDSKDLKKNEAMLFVFDSPTSVTFTMSNVNFPIQIYALDEKMKVLDEALMKPSQKQKTKLTGTLFLEIPVVK